MKAPDFRIVRDDFLAAIRRPHGIYVVNMLRVAEHDPERPLEDMIAKNVIVAITNSDELSQLVEVLYQVRCNVFHGEKIPGDVNDDRIVRAARPLVVELLKRAMSSTAEPVAATGGGGGI